MKKIKFICLILSIIMTVTFLSGCGLVNDMRDTQAFWNGKNIMFKDKEYLEFPFADYLKVDLDNTVWVCESDVPVLLCDFYGDPAVTDEDNRFIMVSGEETVTYYCREDVYNKHFKQAKELKLANYCYEFEYIDAEGDYASDFYILKDKEIEALKDSICEENYVKVQSVPSGEIYLNVIIEGSTADFLFREDYAQIILWNDTYYLNYLSPEPEDFPEKHEINSAVLNMYCIPSKYYDIIDDMVEAYVIGERSLEADYYYYY